MIIFIEKISSYRDGGTISIKGFIQGFEQKEICIDRRIVKGDSSVWIGYPYEKDSIRITDSEFINKLKKEIKNYAEHTNQYKDLILELL